MMLNNKTVSLTLRELPFGWCASQLSQCCQILCQIPGTSGFQGITSPMCPFKSVSGNIGEIRMSMRDGRKRENITLLLF